MKSLPLIIHRRFTVYLGQVHDRDKNIKRRFTSIRKINLEVHAHFSLHVGVLFERLWSR